jgi:choline dehydrogenase-like flavoprotein
VLLLEAGSKRSALGLTLRVAGMTVAKYRRPLHQRQAVTSSADPAARLYEDIAPGGLTNHWSCAVPRFAPEDFEDARRAGEAFRWPLGYADLAPWYDQVEPLLNIAGGSVEHEQLPAGRVHKVRRLDSVWERVASEARRQGRTLAPMPYAYGADTTLTLSGTVFNAFVRLLQPELGRDGLSIRYDARAISLEWSPAERRVVAVRFVNPKTGAEERLACRAVVVAAGAVNSAEILLLSKHADFPQGLGNARGVVGRYLHDHPLGKLVFDLDAPVMIHPASYVTRAEIGRSKPLYAAACMQWSGAMNLAPSVVKGHPGKLPWVGFSVFGTMAPSPDDWVAVDETRRGPDGRAALELHVRHPEAARTVLDEASDDIERILSTVGWGPRRRTWHVEPVGESRHFGGTCRMHDSPEYGVLDGWSRVHDVPNVMVADSAAFTTGPEKNPVLTAMALAARGASRLAEELQRGTL